MATIDLTAQSTGTAYGKGVVYSKKVDFSKNNAAASDVVNLFTIPASTLVVAATLEVITAEGGTATVTVDAGALELFAALTNINAVATLTAVKNTFLTASSTVALTMANDTDAAVVELKVYAIDFN